MSDASCIALCNNQQPHTSHVALQVEKDGCDPSGGQDPRFKCDRFGLAREVDGASIIIGT